jgi:hypothetical protein
MGLDNSPETSEMTSLKQTSEDRHLLSSSDSLYRSKLPSGELFSTEFGMKSGDDDEESELFLNNLRYVEKAFDRVVTYLTFDLSRDRIHWYAK